MAAVSFEYEWMVDGTCLLRFLNITNDIVGQVIVDQKSLVTLQTLIGFAAAKATGISAEEFQSVCSMFGFDLSLSDAEGMLDAARVRADMVSDGGPTMAVIE